MLSGLVDLLHVIWSTNLGQKDTQPEPPQTDPPQPSAKTLPLPLVDEFLCVAFALIPSLRYTRPQHLLLWCTTPPYAPASS